MNDSIKTKLKSGTVIILEPSESKEILSTIDSLELQCFKFGLIASSLRDRVLELNVRILNLENGK